MTAREIPMLFSTAMILALLAGRKTQTRRLRFHGKPGDLIWCRESWRTYASLDGVKPSEVWGADQERGAAIFYAAGGSQFITKGPGPRTWSQDDESGHPGAGKLRPSLFLPRWGSRLTLRVTDVRREPLQSISEADAIAEGIFPVDCSPWPEPQWTMYDVPHSTTPDPRFSYESLWGAINGPASWAANPDVDAVTFEVLRESIASITQPRAPEAAL